MLRCLTTLSFVSSFLVGSLIAINVRLEASCFQWGSYGNERGAWGGNGGWWGDSRSDWYGEYGTPEEYDYFGNHTTPYYSYYRHPCRRSYHSRNHYPHHSEYYRESVDGAGIYFTR